MLNDPGTGTVDFQTVTGSQGGAAKWGAVFALTLCVGTLIASEFMPVSLLTPLARDLNLSEGAAGQAVSISGLFAVISSLSISTLTRRVDRKTVLLVLTGLMCLSGLFVTFAPTFLVLMIGRALLGIVIGGFWSMSAAIVMRLVPDKDTPRALALLNGGNALATTVAAPLGSFLGQFIGWRGAFFVVVPLAALTFAWQWAALPSLPFNSPNKTVGPFGVLKLPHAVAGMISIALLFIGQFSLFTYIRPFLEGVTGVSVNVLSATLLAMGGAGILGNVLLARIVDRKLITILIVSPVLMSAIAVALVIFGNASIPAAICLTLWGLIGTALPTAWWAWLSRSFADHAEAAGGLMVAVVQLAITFGAAGGGLLYDHLGYRATFMSSASCLVLSAVVFAVFVGRSPLLSLKVSK
jgi:predicted MFS family arabinose efflux permease